MVTHPCVTYTKEEKTGVGEVTSRTPLDVLYVDKLVTVRNESVNFWYFCRDITLVVPILCSVAHSTMYVHTSSMNPKSTEQPR